MGNVDIKRYGTVSAIQHAELIEESMGMALNECKDLKAFLSSATWKGQARNEFLTYIEIIEKYHDSMNKILSEHTVALKNLEVYTGNFSNDSLVRKVKSI